MTGIKRRRLGKTGLEVTEIGLGGVFFSDIGTDREEGVRTVQHALKLGVNYIDTAPFYGDSQKVLGEALDGCKENYLLGTKCGRWDWQTGPYRDLNAYKKQFEQSLKDLRRDSVDILYIHEADWAVYWQDMEMPCGQCELQAEKNYDYSSAPVVQFLHWARENGAVKHLGISGNNAHLLAKVLRESDLDIEVVLVAFQYSLIWRNARELLLPLAKEMDVAVVLGTPLQQGRLVAPNPQWLREPPAWMDGDTQQRFNMLYEIQQTTGMTLPELGLRFLLQDPDFATVIPGAANVAQLEENVKYSMADPLPTELYTELNSLEKIFSGLYGKDY